MENPQSLSIESFSYSWLIDKTQQPFSLPNPTNESNHHLDKNFIFDIHKCPVSLVHADDIFSDGYIKPANFLARSRTQPSTSAPATPFYSFSNSSNDRRTQKKVFKNFKKSSSKILHECFGFLTRTKGLVFPRKSNRVDDLETKVWEVQNRKSPQNYPMQSSPSSRGVTSYYDVDSDSIKEAILHCKRSFG